MKKSLIAILILALLLPSILAVEVTIKEEFKTGETFFAKFSGNFIDPVLRDNVAFYRTTGGKHTLIPAEYNVIKIDEEYYVWATLPEVADNYTIEISDVRHKVGTSESIDDIITEFIVTTDIASFQINPGVAYTKDDFEISLQNMLDKKISIDIITSAVSGDTSKFWFFSPIVEVEDKVTIELKSGEDKNIKFRVDAISLPSRKDIEITSEDTSYIVPVYIFRNQSISGEEIPMNPEVNYGFTLSKMNATMPTSSNKTKIVYLKNYGKDDLENINFSLSGILKKYAELSINNIEELKANESKKIEIYFKSGIEEKNIEAQLSASIEGADYVYLPIFFSIVKGYIPANGEEEEEEEMPPCYRCSSNEVCDIDEDATGCCYGLCEEKESSTEEPSSIGKIIGWIIIVVILIFLAWFYKFKYRGTKRKKVDLLKTKRKIDF